MADLVPIYCAHRLGAGPDRERNRRNASQWVAWLARRYLVEPRCTWIVLSEVWPETERALGLEIDRAAVERVGLVFACGPEMSPGVSAECGWATDIIDVTRFGCELPEQLTEDELEWIDAEMAERGIGRRDG